MLRQNGATRSSSTSQVSVFRDPTDAGDGQAVDQHGNPLLYIRYQPGGPGEKSLILKELTQLPKTQTMSELATALRSWRRHFGRAREVGASIHYHAVSCCIYCFRRFYSHPRTMASWLHEAWVAQLLQKASHGTCHGTQMNANPTRQSEPSVIICPSRQP